MKTRKPQILLLGNGINRAFDSSSWDDLLNSIDRRRERYDIGGFHVPEALKAILLTEDNVDKALKSKKHELANLGTENHEQQTRILRRLLALPFDEILTTNYSYELETAALGSHALSERALRNMQGHSDEVSRCEHRFLLHTFNRIITEHGERRIWHIHGEARKHGSMILGAYFYGNLLGKLVELDKKRGNFFQRQQQSHPGELPKIRSWADAFILGDVYILGFGFGFSETDLWWLLNRKKREPGVGKVYFYELKPIEETNRAKLDLLKLMGVKIIYNTVVDNNWREAYERAVSDIERRVGK